MKTVNPGQVAFLEQLRLGLQPVLHLVPGQRTLVHITEVGPTRHFIRRRRKIRSALVQVRDRTRPRRTGWSLVLILGEFIVFHEGSMDCAHTRPLWGVHPNGRT